MEIEEIIDSYVNGNFVQFLEQVEDFGAYQFFRLLKYNPELLRSDSVFKSMALLYLCKIEY